MMGLDAWATLASGSVVAAWGLLAALLPRAVGRVPRADGSRGAGAAHEPPLVSVIVPARNEEALIARCLASLSAQTYPALEVIVVDDHSSDGTRAIAERTARVVRAPDAPPGWTGKCWAAWQGAAASKGEWLLFLDADAILAPSCIGVALGAAADADLLSLMPRARCATALEAIVQPVMLMLLLWRDDPRRLNDPRDASAAAPGSFLLFRRAAYERVGGHAAVRAEVVDDRKIAERVKHGGLRLRVVAAPTLLETSRPLELLGLWNGWTRVVPEGVGQRARAATLGAGAVQTMFLLPYFLAPLGPTLAMLAAAHFVLSLVVRWQLRSAYGVDARFAWLQPLGAVFAVLVLLRAIAPARVHWRGRSYAV
jgi:cellulose synthase/poly-beta-1,6-N-acetylglucosamine synthase-like glycosyltransferase